MGKKEFIETMDEQAKKNKEDEDHYFGELWDNRPGVEFSETEQAVRDERMEDWND